MPVMEMPEQKDLSDYVSFDAVHKCLHDRGYPVTYTDIKESFDEMVADNVERGVMWADQTHIKPVRYRGENCLWLSREQIVEKAWEVYLLDGEAIDQNIKEVNEFLANIEPKKPKPLPNIKKNFWRHTWESIKRRFTDG